MDNDLGTLSSLLADFIKLKKYRNEFETMRPLFDKIPANVRSFYYKPPLHWLQTLEDDENTEFAMKEDDERLKESNNLRKEGNRLFSADEAHRNVLGACRLYNDAIFAALDCEGNVDEFALAFANRAMALQAFGYYQQAYDDCVYALEYGYPVALRNKIVTRQAYCALKLKDVKAVERHLEELAELSLNDNFRKQLKDLHLELVSLKSVNNDNEKIPLKEILLGRDSQEIIDSLTEKGSYMRAKCAIPKNKLIFTERAAAIVPVYNEQRRLCHQCFVTNFIPYPCRRCRGRVVYCSLKCQKEHRSLHVYECAGYRFQLFAHVGIAHLALRMLLDKGIFSIVDHIKAKSNTAEIWSSLTNGGEILCDKKIPYAESLRMISHMDKMDKTEIVLFASISYILVVYLKHYTKFFDYLLEKNSHCIDWELLISALILRHIGQLTVNAHTLITIVPKPFVFTSTDFQLLNDRIWTSPLHLKPGCLNTYAQCTGMAVLNLPYLSICNHSCVQSFHPKFSGRFLSTYASRDINDGEEISNCYYSDFRQCKSSHRRQRLQSIFYFECQCENCVLPEQDKAFNQYHQYRCENGKCRQIFIPQIPHESLKWWLKSETNEIFDVTVRCTNCGCNQRFEWYAEIESLTNNSAHVDARRRLYQIFKSLGNTLLGLNEARAYVANLICKEWFILPNLGICLHDVDYQEIVEMVKYTLECTKSQECVNSVEYVTGMTYLWDVIALGKYKYSNQEMDEMLFALSIISDDLKVIFLNYYNGYIKNKS